MQHLKNVPSVMRPCRGPTPFHVAPTKRTVRTRAAQPDQAAMQEAYQKAMRDPAMAARLKAMQESMSHPEVQQQIQQMQAVMGNPQLQARMQQLRNDPEFADFWKDIQTGGIGALMKYYNNPAFLAKLNSKVADVVPAAVAGAAGGAPAAAAAAGVGAPAAPEIKDLLDAAKYGDEEAVEDFIAIGKDVGMADKEGRTPLHYASAFNHTQIARLLLSEKAPLEATDSKGNTPLHYAAGYGRTELVEVLLEAGASKAAKNANGSTPYALATADPRNPLSSDEAILAKLKA